MMMAQNVSASKITELLESMTQLFRFVEEAAESGKPVHEVELGIWQRLLALGRQTLEQFLTAQGRGDVGPTFTTPEGRVLQRLATLSPRRDRRSLPLRGERPHGTGRNALDHPRRPSHARLADHVCQRPMGGVP